MSYRNPKIIDDKSGQVLGQAIAQGAQNISKGIIGMEAQNRAAKEKKEKEAKEKLAADRLKSDKTAAAILKSTSDKGAWAANVAKNMKGLSQSTTELMNTYIEDELALSKERINGAYGPAYLERVAANQRDIAQLNESAAGWISSGAYGQKYLSLTTKQRQNMVAFPHIGVSSTVDGVSAVDKGAAIEDAVFAGAGFIGYNYSLAKKKDGTPMQKITNPDGESSFMTMEAWNIVKNDMMYVRETNTTTNMEEVVNQGLMIENQTTGKKELKTGFASGEPTQMESEGYNVNRQVFNNDAVAALMDQTAMSVYANIEAFDDAPHKQALWLKDLGLDESYNKLKDTPAKGEMAAQTAKALRVKGIKDRPEFKEQFLNLMGIKEDGNGGYYKDTKLTKISEGVTTTQRLENYNDFNVGLKSLITTAGDAPVGIKPAMELLSVGPGKKLTINSKRRPINDAVFNGNTLTVKWDNPKFDSSASDQSIEKYNYPDRNIEGLDGNPVKPAKNLNEKTFDLSNYVVLTNLIQDAGYVSATQAREMATNLQNANKARE